VIVILEDKFAYVHARAALSRSEQRTSFDCLLMSISVWPAVQYTARSYHRASMSLQNAVGRGSTGILLAQKCKTADYLPVKLMSSTA